MVFLLPLPAPAAAAAAARSLASVSAVARLQCLPGASPWRLRCPHMVLAGTLRGQDPAESGGPLRRLRARLHQLAGR